MDALTEKVKKAHEERFDNTPLMVYSPGRVNLIGEHTDYNNGFVLPAAIDRAIILAMSRNDTGKIRLLSVDMDSEYFELSVNPKYHKVETGWVNYILGVVEELQKAGYYTDDFGNLIGGFDCVFGGDIPIGAGLSSSAALGGGVAYGLSKLFGLGVKRREMAKIAQLAENRFVGVRCGIMDQFASLYGKKDRVIKLDCRSLEFERYPFVWNELCILLCDTNIRRELVGSNYNLRRQQCEEGVAVIKKTDPAVESLRDVSIIQLESHKRELDEVVYRRCRYVLEENERLRQACEHLLAEDLYAFGQKMYQSHYGLRDDYGVSCKELDLLVEAAENMNGVIGSRMMGGGFGGCTINLVTREALGEAKANIGDYYTKHTGMFPGFHVVTIGEGTHLIK